MYLVAGILSFCFIKKLSVLVPFLDAVQEVLKFNLFHGGESLFKVPLLLLVLPGQLLLLVNLVLRGLMLLFVNPELLQILLLISNLTLPLGISFLLDKLLYFVVVILFFHLKKRLHQEKLHYRKILKI